MTATEQQVISGLEGVLAFESSVAFIDGPNGTLNYRGYNIHDFAETRSFEDVVFLLWNARWPDEAESRTFSDELKALRALPDAVVQTLRLLPLDQMNPIAALRTAVSVFGSLDPLQDSIEPEATLSKAMNLTANMATMVAAIHRMAEGRDPIEPDTRLSHAENYLLMLNGERPDEQSTKAMDASLVLYAEHETNASTFATRVAVSTLTDLYSATLAGLAALKGPLHGGAVDEAMRLFMDIGSVEGADPYISESLAQRRKVAGFGHRVYRTRDPRAEHLDRLAKELGERRGDTRWYDIAVEVERLMMDKLGQKGRTDIRANVDYFAAIALYHLGFPLSLQTSFVASSRIAGWSAHAMEQYAANRLIRPRAKYTGQLNQPMPTNQD
jgi:citrate synthase